MAAPRSRAPRVPALVGLFVGFHGALAVAAVALTRPVEVPPLPTTPPVEIVQAAPTDPAPPATPADDETPPEPAAPATVTVAALPAPDAAPAPPPTTIPADIDDEDDDDAATTTDAVPAGRLVAPLPAPRWTPEELQASLLRIPEVSLQYPTLPVVPRTGRVVGELHPVLVLINARPDLHGLPARSGPAAQLPRAESDAVRDASILLRKEFSLVIGRESAGGRRLAVRPEVLKSRPEVVARIMHQMLQGEAIPLRKILVAQLKRMHNPAASRALAHRAVFEPLPELRQMAVKALAGRPPAEYLPVLLDAFRSPWPPAADLAADALVALGPAEAVPELVRRLDAPDPAAPTTGSDGPPTVHELVRVNHARNCALCHPQSVSSRDNIRVAAPNPLRRLPAPFSLDKYEGGGRGGGGGRSNSDDVFVRPDITYLQQDFSWNLPVASPGPWPPLQRFDFLVRTRPAGRDEVAPLGPEPPQKKAILRALQALTGKDFGDKAADWRAGLSVAQKD